MQKFLKSAARFALKSAILGVVALAAGYGFAWASGESWTLPVVTLAVGSSLLNQLWR